MDNGRILLALALAAGLAGPVGIAVAGSEPGDGAPVFVLAGPWADASAVAVRAGGRPVGPRQPRAGALVFSPDPDFVTRLKAEGAWLVLADPRLLALCGVRT